MPDLCIKLHLHKSRQHHNLRILQSAPLFQLLLQFYLVPFLFPEFQDGWVNKSLIEMKMQMAEASQNSLDRAISYGFNDMNIINMISSENKTTSAKKDKVESDLN